jgi:hypothetical protein
VMYQNKDVKVNDHASGKILYADGGHAHIIFSVNRYS